MTEKSTAVELPDWVISDEEIEEALMSQGWITDYVNYARTVTDAPLAYHYATAVTVMLQALSHTDIRVYTDDKELHSKTGRHYELPTPLWSAIIGLSGDRKSFAMDLGLDLLRRAVGNEVILPTDGSIEAWTDYLADWPNLLLHREELSLLFSQSRRAYMDGLKDWLLTLHSGRRYDRTTRRKKKVADDKGMEHETGDNEHVVIERPRVSILGAMPPEVFRTKSDQLDWSSGFFARFMFMPGVRTDYQAAPTRQAKAEGELAKTLHEIHKAIQRPVRIPPAVAEIVSSWIRDEVEPLRGNVDDQIYSHFTRYLDLGYRLTAAQAASYWRGGDIEVLATPKHAKAVRFALSALKEAMLHLFAVAVKTNERSFEDELFEFFRRHPKTWFTLDDLDDHFPKYSRRRLSSWCREMKADERLQLKKVRPNTQRRGARRISYRIAK